MGGDQAAALTGWRALGCGILRRAFRDAHSKNGEAARKEAGIPEGITLADDARLFLHSEGGRCLWLLLELDGTLYDRALAGVPRVEVWQLTLFRE